MPFRLKSLPFAILETGLYQPDVHARLPQNQDDGFSNLKSGFPVQKFHSMNEPVYPIAIITSLEQRLQVNLLQVFAGLTQPVTARIT